MRPAQRNTLNSATSPRISRLRSRCCATGLGQGQVERHGTLVSIIGVDDRRLNQLTRWAGKFRQQQYALFVIACRYILFGHQIHAIVQAADKTQVAGAVVGVNRCGIVMFHIEQDR